jgi:hypothetical protein
MYESPRKRTGRAGGLLLLVLALAACGGDAGEGDGGAGPPSPPADASVRRAADLPADTCAPSPRVDPALLANGASWSALEQWSGSAGVAFDTAPTDSSSASVKLCDTCTAVTLQIVSEHRTYCNGRQSLVDSTRIVGVWRVQSGTVAPPGWGKTFAAGDSILVFARDTLAPAILVYRTPQGTVQRAPDTAWTFRFCADGETHGRAQSRWRKHPRPPRVDPQPEKGRDEVDDDEGPGTYGWMACANGCCQFYIPPTGGNGNSELHRAPPCRPQPHP